MTTQTKGVSTTQPIKATEEIEETKASSTPLPWLTPELLLFSIILVLALALRLWQLGAYPLSNIEAEQSLIALSLSQGDMPESTQYSPLLLSLNTLTFFLFGANDASARLASVLLGSLLVFLPFTLRRQLGPLTCLITSALLAFSPTAIFLSRTLNSEIGVAAGALMLISGFFNWVDEEGQSRWLWLMAAGLALLLASGPMAYSVLVIFALIILIRFSTFKAFWVQGVKHTTSRSMVNSAIFLVVTLVLLATTATLNLAGFSVLTTSLASWLGHFSFQSTPEAGFNAVFLLTIYEPLVVLAGLIGLAYTFLRKSFLETVLSSWFIGLLLLDLGMGGRSNSHVILSLVPLTFLAAIALTELAESLHQGATWSNEGILLAAGLIIAAFGYIGLTTWLTRTCTPEDRICQYGWLQPIATLILFLIVAAFFGFMSHIKTAWRGVALTGMAIGLFVTINIGWRLNYGSLMHLAYQPLAGIPPSTELIELKETLARESEARVGDAALLDITLVDINHPALQWQLRDYPHLTQANTPWETAITTALITPIHYSEQLDLGQPYFGQDFGLDAIWTPVGLPVKEFLHWLIYRQTNQLPGENRVILWLSLTES